MNPNEKISPPMDTNEAIRRLLAVFTDSNGNLRPGVPGGPLSGEDYNVTRVTARGPLPALAVLLVPTNPKVVARLIQNLDDVETIWFSGKPNVTDQTGTTLAAGANIPVSFSGNIYVYCKSGSPVVECTEVLQS